jgi:hypothetical protein
MPGDHSDIGALAYSVTKKYGLHQCYPCAVELRTLLMSRGIGGRSVAIRAKTGGAIGMDDPNFKLPFNAPSGSAISLNGQHFGVAVHGYIFDNIHRTGIPSKSSGPSSLGRCRRHWPTRPSDPST